MELSSGGGFFTEPSFGFLQMKPRSEGQATSFHLPAGLKSISVHASYNTVVEPWLIQMPAVQHTYNFSYTIEVGCTPYVVETIRLSVIPVSIRNILIGAPDIRVVIIKEFTPGGTAVFQTRPKRCASFLSIIQLGSEECWKIQDIIWTYLKNKHLFESPNSEWYMYSFGMRGRLLNICYPALPNNMNII